MKHAPVKQHKPWKERHQMVLSCSILIALIFTVIYVVGAYAMAPLPEKAAKAGALR